MTSGNAAAAGCSHNRGRRAATLMIACGRADERSPTAVNRIIVPQVKEGPSGQGRGRTADLPLFRGSVGPWDHDLLAFMPAQLTGIASGQ
jgi:hypothetical protein